jgi:hypothetical protein
MDGTDNAPGAPSLKPSLRLPRPERGLPRSGTSAHLPDEHSLMTAGYSVCSTAAGIFAADIKERATWLSN